MDKGLGSAEHYTDPSGWKLGDLDYFTVPEHAYTPQEHDIWRALYKRQLDVLPGRAVDWFMDSLSTLGINKDAIPKIDDVNDILMKRSGWKVVPVPGLIPDEPFFEMLANRRFPIGNFIRKPEQFDYIQEPDIFHDLFGHVPILADPVFGDYMQSYGEGGLKAARLGAIDKITRLYWYTVEFGLIEEKDGLRIYGAGILSSPTESVFCLESDSPNRVKFDLKRVLRTHYQIDDFQDTYFVIDSFQQMFDETRPDFTAIYKEIEKLPVIMPEDILPNDGVITRGTNVYAAKADIKREERKKKKKKN